MTNEAGRDEVTGDDRATDASDLADVPDMADAADGSQPTETLTAGTGAPARPPRPGAQAASRARRIGGRPLPGPRSAADEAAARPTLEKAGRRPKAEKVEEPAQRAAGSAAATRTAPRPQPRRLEAQDGRLRWIPAVVAAAALVAALVLGVWQSHGVWWGSFSSDRAQTRTQVLASAKTCTAALLSYDYRKLDASEKAGTDCSTGQFQADYKKSFETVRQLAPQKKTVQTLQIARGGVQSVSDDGRQWVILLYGQLSYTDSATKTPRLDISTPVATLQQVGGRWLVTNLASGG
jgi:Mce-associated membrane protein